MLRNYLIKLTFIQIMMFIYSNETVDVNYTFNLGAYRQVEFCINDTCYHMEYDEDGICTSDTLWKESLKK